MIADSRTIRSSGLALVRIAGALTETNVTPKTGKSIRRAQQAVARILHRMQSWARSRIPTTTAGELRTG